ncbi:MAG: group II intron reverse transcriptase/maturase [Verrucomicrobiota bacterium]
MESACSPPKPSGVATTATTEVGDNQRPSGTASLRGSASELNQTAEETEPKVLNETLLEQVLGEDNVRSAYRAVLANRGAPGIDHLTTTDLGPHLKKYWPGLKTKILENRYKPSPVRPVEIPKPGGGSRCLGIPTVLDRLIQQSLHQQLDQILDPTFSDNSYGFRRGKSAHDAVRAAKHHVVEEDRVWVIDIDIKGYFDAIDHDILMRELAKQIKDKSVLQLIGKYLRSGVLKENGKVERSAKGTPQGGPLSPLLGNFYLDQLDKELESRGHAFCRYADDITIYAKSQRSAERIYASITRWIERYLKLEVNREKSGVRVPSEGSFLGFRITEKGEIALSAKSIARFKQRVREHWRHPHRAEGRVILEQWQRYLRGWVNYFKLSENPWEWRGLEPWIRRHMRKWFWLRWHNWRGRKRAFERLGIEGPRKKIAHSSRGSWRVARALNRILSNRWLREKGFWVPTDLIERLV